MSVSSIGISLPTLALHSTQTPVVPHGASSEARELGPDIDGDGDDSRAKVAQVPSASTAATPSVSGIGQKVGSIVNVKA